MTDTFISPIDPAQATSLRGRLATLMMLDGRIGRGRFWALSALYVVAFAVGIGALPAAGILMDGRAPDIFIPVFALIGVLFVTAMLLAHVSIVVRRLHDRGRSGYWLVLYYLLSMAADGASLQGAGIVYLLLTVGLAAAALIELGMRRGDRGPNAFGPDPLAK